MNIKIVVQSRDKETGGYHATQIWSGEWEINTHDEYISKVSIIAEGEPHPICDIPFALDVGYWHWYPPMAGSEDDTEDRGNEVE